MNELILKTDRLQIKAPNGRTLVRDASFEVRSGECIAIVGPSGAGKTTSVLASPGASARAVQPLGEHFLAGRSRHSGLILPSLPSRPGRRAAHSAADGSL